MRRTGAVFIALGITAVLVVLLVAAYLGGWWLFRDRVQREGEIRRQSFEYQQGRVDGALNQLADIRAIDTQLSNPALDPATAQGLRDQRAGIVRQACKSIAEVPGDIPADLAAFKSREC